MMKKINISQKGFTLLEILLVVAAIAILAGIVIIAINPGKQLADTRNAQREVDVNTILNAVYQYSVDNDGDLPGPDAVPTSATEICSTTGGGCGAGVVDIGDIITDEKYLVAIPVDPTGGAGDGAGYEIFQSTNGRVTISAPDAEQGATISVTR